MRSRALAIFLLACAACSRCGSSRSAASAEVLLPGKPALAASTGQLAALGPRVSGLLEKVAVLPGGEQLGDFRRQLARQLGFDPLTREGLLSAGADPDRSAAMAATLPEGPGGRPAWTLAVPLTRPEAFAQTLEKLLTERAGFPLRAEEARGELKITVFARSASPGPRVAYAVVNGYGLLARGNDPAADIAAAAQRPRDQSLAADPAYSAAHGEGDLTIFAPAGSALGERLARRPLPGDASVALSFGESSVQARVRVQLAPDAAQRLAALLPGGGGELLALLPAGAPLQARLGLQPSEVAASLERVPLLSHALAALRDSAKARGVDLDKDLFGALKPGIALSLASSPNLQLSNVIDFGFLDWRLRSPFDFVQLAALAQVDNKERLLAALDALAQALPTVGAQAVRQGDDWQVSYAGGAGARFGVRQLGGKTVAYLLGGGLSPELLKEDAKAQPALAGPAGMAVALDLGKLSAALAALPETAYGSGPQRMIAQSIVGPLMNQVKPLSGSFKLEPGEGGLTATARIDIAAPTP